MAKPKRPQRLTPDQAAQALLTLLDTLRQELQQGRHSVHTISLDSSLDRDLGFDSLARAEMVARIEHLFQVGLPEQALALSETPRDLLREVLRACQRDPLARPVEVEKVTLQPIEALPERASTLLEVLDWHVQAHAERPHLYLYTEVDHYDTITYGQLQAQAARVAGLLLAEGMEVGLRVAIMLPTSMAYFAAFFGILLAGGVPVPIYPPLRPALLEEHLRRQTGILRNANASWLITVPEAVLVARLLMSQVESLRGVLSTESFAGEQGGPLRQPVTERDIALLQYTSGSTGNPKGVILTHANLLANIRGFGRALAVDSTDVAVSWLPLYHDMGLIGAWLGSLYHAIPLVVCSPLLFLRRPLFWLQTLHRHGGTLSAAPNFAYELCASKLDDAQLRGLDLSRWRAALNGAEPVSPATLRRFGARFAPYGFRPEALLPVYGLAECSVALGIPPLERPPLIDRVDRAALMGAGEALPIGDQETDSSAVLEFVSVGQPIPGHQVRVVDARGRELPERREGRLEFKGASATSGYFRNPDESRKLFRGDWLDSGDRAYLANGEIYITGRDKDIIIRAGRNLYPQELEEAVGNIDGVRKGCVAVFSVSASGPVAERLVVVAETRAEDPQIRDQLRAAILQSCLALLEIPADDVILVAPHTLPKTSSGKIRRAASRELYAQQLLGKSPRALWWQLIRIGVKSALPQIRRSLRAFANLLYGVYAWLVLVLMAPPVWLLMALVVRRGWCRRIAKVAAGWLAGLCATRLQLEGAEQLPKGACVLVANHASYLDGILLTACLPRCPVFVAKTELRASFTVGLLLSRLGTEFVERFDLQRGLADARRITRRVAAGESLLFFPEGTFDRVPGLRPFHLGAFVAAAQSRVPVVPVTIRGTRSKLRDGTWLARPGAVTIRIGAPIMPTAGDWAAALDLRDRARAEILKQCAEPDRAEPGG